MSEERKFEYVGDAHYMPGANGFTMICFKVSDVPDGTKVYVHTREKTEKLFKDLEDAS